MTTISTTKEIVKALTIVCAGHFLVDMMIGFWSVYKTLAGLDIAIMGLIAGICPFIGEGMQIIFGPLGDKGYRKILLGLGMGFAAFNAMIPATHNYNLLFILYLLTCLGSGAFHPTAAAITSGLTENRKALFSTIFAAGGGFGLAFSHLIFSSWYFTDKGMIVYLAFPSICLMFYVLMSKLPNYFSAPAVLEKKHGFREIKNLFKNSKLVTLYIFQVCCQSIIWGLVFLLPDILHSKGYDSWISFGGGHMSLILGGAMMVIPGGYLSDKYSARMVLIGASVISLFLLYLFLLSPLLPIGGLLSLLFVL